MLMGAGVLKFAVIAGSALAAAVTVIVLYAPFILSGRISREEEARELRRHQRCQP